MAPQVQPRLIGLGIALVLVGIVALGLTARDLMARDRVVDSQVSAPIGDGIPADRVNPRLLTMVWRIVGGLSLAIGAAMIGIGMNRWKRQRPTAVPAAHRDPGR